MSRMCKVWETLLYLGTGVHHFEVALLLKSNV